MIRIPIEINEERLMLTAILHVAGARGAPFLKLRFVVDTGSPFTLVGSIDYKRLNLPISLLNFRNHTKLGGCTVECTTLGRKTTLILKDSSETSVRYDFANFGFIKPTDNKVDTLPSLLGMDFLKHNRLKLVCSPSENVAYMESLE